MRIPITASVLLLTSLVSASGAAADTPISLTISGNQASGTISLPGGISAELTITFESAVGLNSSALEASVSLVNPLELLGRLSSGVSLASAFPILLRISPAESSTLTFSGIYTVSLYTHNLSLNPLVPLSLFKGPDGSGLFKDITVFEGVGSYRVSGSGGSFSEFLILVDLRNINNVINGKFNALQSLLNDNAGSMPAAVASSLQTLLTDARNLYLAGSTLAAADKIASFSAYVKSHSGADIPDVWQANNPSVVNVAGLLRAGADTLKFSLVRKAG